LRREKLREVSGSTAQITLHDVSVCFRQTLTVFIYEHEDWIYMLTNTTTYSTVLIYVRFTILIFFPFSYTYSVAVIYAYTVAVD
jgi:hypothetical protein